jgi:hypothetical protein
VNHQEAVVLTRIVAAACPQQAIDDYTPDAWHDLLEDLSFEDCRAALIAMGKRQPFVAPAEIRAEVKRLREDRIARAFIPAPPPELADDPAAYREALAANVQAAADGQVPPATDSPKMIGPPPGERTGGPPVSLRASIRQFRRDLGEARERAIESPEDIAARQVAEHRAIEAERDGTEEAS